MLSNSYVHILKEIKFLMSLMNISLEAAPFFDQLFGPIFLSYYFYISYSCEEKEDLCVMAPLELPTDLS